MRVSATHSSASAAQVEPGPVQRQPAGLARAQHLFDRVQQPLAVLEHHAVELPALLGVEMRRSRDRSVSRCRRIDVTGVFSS